SAARLTITAAASGPVVLADTTCEGKAIFVIKGDDVTVRGITFRGARVPDHNGAGIRAEGRNLTLENSRFIDNEEGLLAGVFTVSTITIRNTYFKGNGLCTSSSCAHAVYVGKIARLNVEN